MHTILSSATKTVRIGDDQPFAIIGERINPTGRKIFQQQLRSGDLSRAEIDVKEQVVPDRHSIAATFLPIAISHGLTSAIMDARAPQVVRAVKAADLVLNRDEWGANWIAAHRAAQSPAGPQAQGQVAT